MARCIGVRGLSCGFERIGIINIQPSVPIADGCATRYADFYLWHLFDSIPGIKFAETLGWEQRYKYSDNLSGWLLLSFKLLVIVSVIGSLSYAGVCAAKWPVRPPFPTRTSEEERCLTLRCTRHATAGFASLRMRVNSNVMRHRQDIGAAESHWPPLARLARTDGLGEAIGEGDVDADSIPSQRAIPARAAGRCDGCGGAGPTRARQALFRGSHEALRARRGPAVGCVALWSDGDR